jgi:dihydrofolate reductase
MGKVILGMTMSLDGIGSAIEKARMAAAEKDVTMIGGADIFQQCLNKGLVDELQIDIAPVLLGEGLRLFEHINAEAIELENTGVLESAGVTHLRFRIVK